MPIISLKKADIDANAQYIRSNRTLFKGLEEQITCFWLLSKYISLLILWSSSNFTRDDGAKYFRYGYVNVLWKYPIIFYRYFIFI